MRNQFPTRLTLFCDRIIEGCWLTALIATPLFFNVYSIRIFEPDKTVMLRSIMLILGLAWTVKGLEQWAANESHQAPRPIHLARFLLRSLPRRLAAVPVLLLVLLLLIDYVFATFISVAPRVSLWGSYTRLQGLYTTTAYIGVFLSILALMRTRVQLERLLTAALVVSLPVSLYGIIQYFGTDPLLWGSDVTLRVASSMGNPIFVAAFLIMTVPLSLYRLLVSGSTAAKNERIGTTRVLVMGGLLSLAFQMAAWQAGPSAGTASAVITTATWIAVALLLGKPIIPFLRISSYTVLLSAQLMCIVFSQSRGPWLGLGAGLFVFALLWALVRRQRKRALVVIGSGLTVALLLVALNWPGSPLGFVRGVPYVGKLSQLSNTDAGSARVRVLIWEGVEDLLSDDPLRAIIGYGPETLQLIYPPHYRPELGHVQGRIASADRAHNETFDALVTTGFIGFALYLLFFTSLFYYGLKWIGLLRTRVQRRLFLCLWFVCGASGALLVFLIDGSWRFAGVSLPAGMIAGLLFYLCGYGLFVKADWYSESVDESLKLIVATLLAAVVAHFFEIQVGLAIVATRTYFWCYAALLGVFVFFHRQRPRLVDDLQPMPPATRPFARAPLVTSSLLVGFILLTLLFDFAVPRRLEEAPTVLWLLVFTWSFAGCIIITEIWQADYSRRDLREWLAGFGIYAGITLILTVLFAAILARILQLGDDLGDLLLTYSGAVLLTIVALGLALLWSEPLSDRTWVRRLSPVYLVLAVGALSAAYITNLNVVRADVYVKQASQLNRQGRYDQAAALYRRALDLQPKQDVYYLGLGQILLQKAEGSKDSEALLHDTESALLTAQSLSPLNPDHTANLARLYQAMAKRLEDPPARAERLSQAISFFEQATTLSPNTAHLWNDMGTTRLLMGDTTEARQIYEHSLTVDETMYETYLLMGNLDFAEGRWADAARAYEEVIRLEPGLTQVRLALQFARAQTER